MRKVKIKHEKNYNDNINTQKNDRIEVVISINEMKQVLHKHRNTKKNPIDVVYEHIC